VSRKSRIAVLILSAALIALSLCAVPGAMAKSSSSSHQLRFKVVKRTSHYDVVKGHAKRFAVKRGAHRVTVRGVGRCKMVRRTPHYVFLRALSSQSSSRLTIMSPNSGAFIEGSPTTITWRMSSDVSSGYFRLSLQNTVTGSSTALTASSVSTNRRITSYSVPWNVAQAAGTYKIWVYYYNSGGWSQTSDSSDSAVTIALAPVPTPTPTPTVTPTPTPTPPQTWAGAGPAPGTVFKDVGALILRGTTAGDNNRTYDGYRFTGPSYNNDIENGVITLAAGVHSVTFRNCWINTNTIAGNGVLVADSGRGSYDITFDHCYFAYQPRMGFECIERPSSPYLTGYQRINITNCYFEAQGSEAISYDDAAPGNASPAGNCTISGNVVLGAGLNSAYGWRRLFELNRVRNMTVTNNWFGPGTDGMTNLRQTLGDPSPANWTFSGNTWDATAYLPGVTYGSTGVPHPTLWYMYGLQGGLTVADTLIASASPYSTGSWAYLDTVSNADFSGSTIHGCPANGYGTSGSVTGISCPREN